MATKNRKGRIEVEVFVVLITIVITSAIILLLVKSGTLKVKDDVMPEPVLNAEFLPVGKEGSIAVKDVALCNYVDESLNCLSRQSEFGNTEPVYVWFVVESNVNDGQIMLLRNHKITNPRGEVVLQNEQKNAYNFELESNKNTEEVVFADFFVMGEDALPGEYTLDVVLENPLLDKKVTLTKKFTIVEKGLI
ncbi:MAG TPA: hypothetical protein VJB13_02725 [Candidatus Nanoarchaeia archaeon]|nr:hypothetical protein [Candidatus Nanoarchaeia archaeon]